MNCSNFRFEQIQANATTKQIHSDSLSTLAPKSFDFRRIRIRFLLESVDLDVFAGKLGLDLLTPTLTKEKDDKVEGRGGGGLLRGILVQFKGKLGSDRFKRKILIRESWARI